MLHFCYMWEFGCRLYREVLGIFGAKFHGNGQKFTEKHGQIERIAVVLILSTVLSVGVDRPVLEVILAWEFLGFP